MTNDSYSNTMIEVVAYKGGHARSQGFVLLKRNGVNFGVHKRVVDVYDPKSKNTCQEEVYEHGT